MYVSVDLGVGDDAESFSHVSHDGEFLFEAFGEVAVESFVGVGCEVSYFSDVEEDGVACLVCVGDDLFDVVEEVEFFESVVFFVFVGEDVVVFLVVHDVEDVEVGVGALGC